jgi:hypothetical protein
VSNHRGETMLTMLSCPKKMLIDSHDRCLVPMTPDTPRPIVGMLLRKHAHDL